MSPLPATAPPPRLDAAAQDAPAASPLLPRLLLGAGLAAVVLAASPYAAFDLDRHTVPKAFVLHATAALVTAGTVALAPVLTLTAIDLALAAFVALSTLSALLAPNPWLAWSAVAISASGALVLWSARQLAAGEGGERLARTVAMATTLGALTGLLQAYGVVTSLSALARAPGGTFGNRNFMAHATAIGLPLVAWLALAARTRGGGLLALLAALLSSAALVLSRSRAAWLAAGVALAVVLAVTLLRARGRSRGAGVTALLGALALGAALALVLPNRLQWKSDSPYLDSLRGLVNHREGSGRGRLVQYRNTLRLVQRDPVLGVGPGNWPVRYPEVRSPNDPSYDARLLIPTNPWPSSDLVAMVAERGVPAALLLGGTLLLVLLAVARPAVPLDATRALPLEVAAGAAVLAALVAGAFDAVLLLPAPMLIVATAAGIATRGARAGRAVDVRWPARAALVLLVLAVGALGALRAAQQFRAMAAYATARSARAREAAAAIDPGNFKLQMLVAQEALARGRCRTAREFAEAAARLNPGVESPGRVLGRCR